MQLIDAILGNSRTLPMACRGLSIRKGSPKRHGVLMGVRMMASGMVTAESGSVTAAEMVDIRGAVATAERLAVVRSALVAAELGGVEAAETAELLEAVEGHSVILGRRTSAARLHVELGAAGAMATGIAISTCSWM